MTLQKALPKMNTSIEDCGAKLFLIDGPVRILIKVCVSDHKSWPQGIEFREHSELIVNKQSRDSVGYQFDSPRDIAFLQYTSGSTGSPKGVIISFGALHANVQYIMKNIDHAFDNCDANTENIAWLPQ